MIKSKISIFFLIFFFLSSCSFDDKTGIWSGGEKERKRISDIENEQKQIINTKNIYSSSNINLPEISLKKNINLSKPVKNLSWKMSTLNLQNSLGNIYLSSIDNIFLKKKIGKNKSKVLQSINSPLILDNNIIISDEKGTIFNIDLNGKVKWKKNIYKKIFKRVYKKLTISIYSGKIYVADNIGFVYSISLKNGELLWIKNHGTPLKSNIKVFKNKIFLINQDNRVICFSAIDGLKIWDIRSISSFIKNQDFLSLAISQEGDVVVINSSGTLFKVNGENGSLYWSLETIGSKFEHDTDFFKSSKVVIDDKNIIFSASSSIFSFKLDTGYINWEKKMNSVGAPIIDRKNIFFVTDSGHFVIIEKNTGEVISSTNILTILKKKKQNTKVTGFIMGSGKIYAVTLNGYLIVSSASSGKPEYFSKIGDPITTSPIISDGKLYILTENSRIFGFN